MKSDDSMDYEKLDAAIEECVAEFQENKEPFAPEVPPKDGFIFFRSFAQAIDLLPLRMKLKAYEAIVKYGVWGTIPPKELPARIQQIFLMAQPTMDNMERLRKEGFIKGKKGASHGIKGGRPKNIKQTVAEQYSSINDNDNDLAHSDEDEI